jgi:hypothetical protein
MLVVIALAVWVLSAAAGRLVHSGRGWTLALLSLVVVGLVLGCGLLGHASVMAVGRSPCGRTFIPTFYPLRS